MPIARSQEYRPVGTRHPAYPPTTLSRQAATARAVHGKPALLTRPSGADPRVTKRQHKAPEAFPSGRLPTAHAHALQFPPSWAPFSPIGPGYAREALRGPEYPSQGIPPANINLPHHHQHPTVWDEAAHRGLPSGGSLYSPTAETNSSSSSTSTAVGGQTPLPTVLSRHQPSHPSPLPLHATQTSDVARFVGQSDFVPPPPPLLATSPSSFSPRGGLPYAQPFHHFEHHQHGFPFSPYPHLTNNHSLAPFPHSFPSLAHPPLPTPSGPVSYEETHTWPTTTTTTTFSSSSSSSSIGQPPMPGDTQPRLTADPSPHDEGYPISSQVRLYMHADSTHEYRQIISFPRELADHDLLIDSIDQPFSQAQVPYLQSPFSVFPSPQVSERTYHGQPTALTAFAPGPDNSMDSVPEPPSPDIDRGYVKVARSDANSDGDISLSESSDVDADVFVKPDIQVPRAPLLFARRTKAGTHNGPAVRWKDRRPIKGTGESSSSSRAKKATKDDFENVGLTVPAEPLPRSKERKKRDKFTEEQRKQTNETRAWGACLRCSAQRASCQPNAEFPDDPDKPCQTCLLVCKTSRKVIHDVLCMRDRIINITSRRSGGLYLTQRFTEDEMIDIRDYDDSYIKTIHMSLGLCKSPVILQVRRFNPIQGDVTFRSYVVNGERKLQQIAPYCLADIEKTATDFRQYVCNNAFRGLLEAEQNDDLVRITFSMISKYFFSLPDELTGKGKLNGPNPYKKLLGDAVMFWFATRHSTGSAWIDGEETLGMQLPDDPNYPTRGKISLPRMITAQFDSIQNKRILPKLAEDTLKALEAVLKAGNPDSWFTAYLVTFLLLHQVGIFSRNRRRWAVQNDLLETRYGPRSGPRAGLTKFVEGLQGGSWVILVYWHYFKKKQDLLQTDWDGPKTSWPGAKGTVRPLDSDQCAFMRDSMNMMKERLDTIENLPGEERWDHELYYVSKMMKPELKAYDTFSLA